MKNDFPPFIVSTDLDGTLLDHYSYSWQAALPSIEQLKARNCPIIINTSKTFEEVKALQTELGLDSPFIVENGSAIYCPKTCAYADQFDEYDSEFNRKVLGTVQDEIVTQLQQLRSETGWEFEGYSDWGTDDIIKHTGLSLDKAKLSQQRQFSEPILWHDNEVIYTQFERAIKLLGFRVIRGGRFIHILGLSDKGQALQSLQSIVAKHFEHTSIAQKAAQKLICLGDSYNDLDMLKISDYPVFVRSPVHGYPEHQIEQDAIFTRAFGPEGWHEAITHILKNN